MRSREVACVEQGHCQVLIVQGTSKHHVNIWTLIALVRALDDGGRNKSTLLAQLVLVDGYHLPVRVGEREWIKNIRTHTQFWHTLTKHSVSLGYARGSTV